MPDHPRTDLRITADPIDHHAVVDSVRSDQAGAIVSFLGTVREWTGAQQTASLAYEAYPALAEPVLARLAAEARQRWPIEHLAVVHRVGHLALGEVCVVVAVSCPHRDAAFEAARWLIDTLKQVVPIWKQETGPDGLGQWVHPADADAHAPGPALSPTGGPDQK